MDQFDKPLLGVDYYPEDWPESEIDTDIRKMQEDGIKLIRIGEFAWSKMEPAEGEIHFEWLDDIISRFAAAGIKTILGTTSATPPQWFCRKYPDAIMEQESGRRYSTGGRRYFCENHPGYRQQVADFTEKMAAHFGTNPDVVGWQIDNEIYPDRNGCYCDNCRNAFHAYLKEKYGTIDAVNKAWGTAHLFSQQYDSFDDIPLPRDAWINPHIRFEWRNFKCESMVRFVHMQSDIIHRYSKAPVGTDVMPVPDISYERMFAPMDVVMFNHYNTPDDLEDVAFWFDHLRTLRERPFWNTETAVNWNGSVAINQSIKPEGFSRANTWLPVAMGGEASMYWLWRTHWAGHELMHGALLDTCGKPAHTIGEVRQTAADFDKAGSFLKETKPVTDAAICYSPLASSMSAAEPIVEGFDYMQNIRRFHHAAVDAGLDPDVIDPVKDLSGYKLVVTPMLMTLEEAKIGEKLADFVRNGGVWVVGPFTDIRDMAGAKYKDRHFGMLEAFTGVEWLYGIPDRENRLALQNVAEHELPDETWVDVYDIDRESADVTVRSGYSTLEGMGVCYTRQIGKGYVIVLGTFLSRENLVRVYERAEELAGIRPVRSENGTIAVRRAARSAGEICGLTLVEIHDKEDTVHTGRASTDLLTGEQFTGDVPMAPYGVRVLKF